MKVIRINKLVTGIMLLAGVVSGFFIYLGFQAFGGNDFLKAFVYFSVVIGGLAVNGFRLYRMLEISQKDLLEKEFVTTLKCNKCDLKIERPFAPGDYIYKTKGSCGDCSAQLVVTKIFAYEAGN